MRRARVRPPLVTAGWMAVWPSRLLTEANRPARLRQEDTPLIRVDFRFSYLTIIGLSIVIAVGALSAREPSFEEYGAVQDSLSGVHPRMRASWLRERGFDDSYYTTFRKPESTGLRCIGRWPWGPSWELCGRDSLLFLGSGSGVRILSISDSTHPRMLGQINARGLINELEIHDTLLYVACGNWGAQVYSVADPANPRELGSMDGVIGDLTVLDTICYAVGGDSFRIFNVADPTQPQQLSVVCDTGNVIAVTNGHAFLGCGSVLNVYDVAVPSSPQWVNSRGGDFWTISARRGLLFHASYNPVHLAILDVSDVGDIRQLSRLDGISALGMYIDDHFAYLAYAGLHVIDVTDSTNPVERGVSSHYDVEQEPFVFTPQSYAYLACRYGGLKVIDLHQVTAPRETTTCYVAGSAQDISLNGTVGFIPGLLAGANTVDFSDPAEPRDLGWLNDQSGYDEVAFSGVLSDSFAFAGWFNTPFFRVVDVTDPTNMSVVGSCDPFEYAQDMVLRDTLVYCADHYKFEVINIARPREPEVVGTCDLPERTRRLFVRDTFAYVAQGYTGLIILSVARPDSPRELGRYVSVRSTHGVCVLDTIAYIAEFDSGLTIVNVANPQACYKLGSHPTPAWAYDVLVVDTLAYVACRDGVRVFDVSDLTRPAEVGFCTTPHWAWRLDHDAPRLFVACYDAGVYVLESCTTGLAERLPPQAPAKYGIDVLPSPARADIVLRIGGLTHPGWLAVLDVTGRRVRNAPVPAGRKEQGVRVDVSELPAGLYFVEVVSAGRIKRGRFVRQ